MVAALKAPERQTVIYSFKAYLEAAIRIPDQDYLPFVRLLGMMGYDDVLWCGAQALALYDSEQGEPYFAAYGQRWCIALNKMGFVSCASREATEITVMKYLYARGWRACNCTLDKGAAWVEETEETPADVQLVLL